MNSYGIEISIAGCVREMVRDPNPMPFFFFFFFFYIIRSLLFRCKKLLAAPAMERTKPINQNKTRKETISTILRGN